MKKNHEYYEMLISRYKDNDLDTNEIFEMEKHLSSCKSCQKFKDELDSMSYILLGMSNIKINKKPENIFTKKRIIASISSIAAALLIFAGVSTIYNNQNNGIGDNAKLMLSDLTDITASSIIDYEIKEEDYAPLSSYFSYNDFNDTEETKAEDEEKTTESEISIMSAYMYYMGK